MKKQVVITKEEVQDAIEKDQRAYRDATEIERKNFRFPSGIGLLTWINFSDQNKYYARALMQLKYGHYIPPEDLKFNNEVQFYYAVINLQ